MLLKYFDFISTQIKNQSTGSTSLSEGGGKFFKASFNALKKKYMNFSVVVVES